LIYNCCLSGESLRDARQKQLGEEEGKASRIQDTI
jgi:hypothetical protein